LKKNFSRSFNLLNTADVKGPSQEADFIGTRAVKVKGMAGVGSYKAREKREELKAKYKENNVPVR
jgi:hypothetical protein